jgi:glyoxylate/hydroxypyruvate reductase
MPPIALFAGKSDDWPNYRIALAAAFKRAGVAVDLVNTADDPAQVDYIIYAPNGGLSDFTPFTGLKAVLSLWAGVESFQNSATLTAPLARMVDQGLSLGMAEWVLGHTMRAHLGMDNHLNGQDGIWRNGIAPPLARDRKVGILGLGELGRTCADYLSRIGFQVSGWSRRKKSVDGVSCFSGDDGLHAVLEASEILILLLPLTAQTEDVLNTQTLALMPKGATIINPGRGPLIEDGALLTALDSGQIKHATLDVFRTEPLPKAHPFWGHPNVTVTPHIASETRAETASDSIAENIRRGEASEPFLYLVDRNQGY